jgi:hypothetical protein
MDPATIGLLISIAPTVLDLLFGQGYHNLNVQDVQEKLKEMYGYGLEGFGYEEGEGYRYPSLAKEEPTLVTIQTKRGPLQVIVPKPTKNGQLPTNLI